MPQRPAPVPVSCPAVIPCGVAAVRHGDGTKVQRPPNAAPAVSALAGTPLQAPPGILAKMASDGRTTAAALAGSSPSAYANMRGVLEVRSRTAASYTFILTAVSHRDAENNNDRERLLMSCRDPANCDVSLWFIFSNL